MARRYLGIAAFLLLVVAPTRAASLEGDQLYRVSTVRAVPGALADLLDWAAPRNTVNFYLMRHSQGDQWDLLFIFPMGSPDLLPVFAEVESLVAFHEDTFAYGPPREAVAKAYEGNDLFHIEMFTALAGRSADLLDQRRMENAYLEATGQTQNMIFRSVAGTDVDLFTIGFHKDLEAFAASSPATDEEREAAAKAAGFQDRADLSFYLRSLISGHHDTLAVKVD